MLDPFLTKRLRRPRIALKPTLLSVRILKGVQTIHPGKKTLQDLIHMSVMDKSATKTNCHTFPQSHGTNALERAQLFYARY